MASLLDLDQVLTNLGIIEQDSLGTQLEHHKGQHLTGGPVIQLQELHLTSFCPQLVMGQRMTGI